MPFRNVADREHVAMLRSLLADFCREYQITGEQLRLEVADLLMTKFALGVECPDELSAELLRAFPHLQRQKRLA